MSDTSSSLSSTRNNDNKRKAITDSCTECYKAHKQCNRERPCERCKRLGIEDKCSDRQRKKREMKKAKWVNLAIGGMFITCIVLTYSGWNFST